MAMFFLRMAQPRETSGGTCMYMGMSQPTLMYVDATYRYELGLKKKRSSIFSTLQINIALCHLGQCVAASFVLPKLWF